MRHPRRHSRLIAIPAAGVVALLGCGSTGSDRPLKDSSKCSDFVDAPDATRRRYVKNAAKRDEGRRVDGDQLTVVVGIIEGSCRKAGEAGEGERIKIGPAYRELFGR